MIRLANRRSKICLGRLKRRSEVISRNLVHGMADHASRQMLSAVNSALLIAEVLAPRPLARPCKSSGVILCRRSETRRTRPSCDPGTADLVKFANQRLLQQTIGHTLHASYYVQSRQSIGSSSCSVTGAAAPNLVWLMGRLMYHVFGFSYMHFLVI